MERRCTYIATVPTRYHRAELGPRVGGLHVRHTQPRHRPLRLKLSTPPCLCNPVHTTQSCSCAFTDDRLTSLCLPLDPQVAAINTAMSSLVKTLNVFPRERTIVTRERGQQSYGILPYLSAKLAAELPVGGCRTRTTAPYHAVQERVYSAHACQAHPYRWAWPRARGVPYVFSALYSQAA